MFFSAKRDSSLDTLQIAVTDSVDRLYAAQTSGVATALDGIWGTSSTDIFAVGAGGVILFSNNDGFPWTQQTSPVNTALDGVWGTERFVTPRSVDVHSAWMGGCLE